MTMAEMNERELKDFKDRLAALATAGDETQVRSFIKDNIQRLPEAMQKELVFNLFYTAVEDELREQEALAQVQEEGLAAAAVLKREEETGGSPS